VVIKIKHVCGASNWEGGEQSGQVGRKELNSITKNNEKENRHGQWGAKQSKKDLGRYHRKKESKKTY